MEACCRKLLGKSRVEKRCEEWCREVFGRSGVEKCCIWFVVFVNSGVEQCWGRAG